MPIHTIDLYFQGDSQTVAAFLTPTEDGPVLIETGPYSTFQSLASGVQKLGYELSDIRHVLLSHIHFDHAGAAWALAELGATIYVHPVGLPHLANPERLLNSARMIYQEKMDSMWGAIHAIAEDRLRAVSHGEYITIGSSQFTAWHTPGHAIHHIAWQLGADIFTGDVGGVYIEGGVVAPPCPPPDIHLEDWKKSLDIIRGLNPDRLWLTHFGPISEVDQHLSALEVAMHDWADWIRPFFEQGMPAEAITPLFVAFVEEDMRNRGCSEELIEKYNLANPAYMSVGGLLRYWKKKN